MNWTGILKVLSCNQGLHCVPIHPCKQSQVLALVGALTGLLCVGSAPVAAAPPQTQWDCSKAGSAAVVPWLVGKEDVTVVFDLGMGGKFSMRLFILNQNDSWVVAARSSAKSKEPDGLMLLLNKTTGKAEVVTLAIDKPAMVDKWTCRRVGHVR